MEDQQLKDLREQIDILERRAREESITRRAASNVLRKHSLMEEYEAEIVLLAELGDIEAILYVQHRPIPIYPTGDNNWPDCSAAEVD